MIPRRLRYIVAPGYVRSRHDSDLHWIGVAQLVELYQLQPGEWTTTRVGLPDGLTILRPSPTGKYGRPQ